MKLYQMAVSHYCEKIRWALDYKKCKYSTEGLLPGLHISVIRKVTKSRSTAMPVLVDGEIVIQNSSTIIDYLEKKYPSPSLTPLDSQQAIQARDWEAFVDDKIGPHVRRCCYHYMLDEKKLLIPMLAKGGPWYGRFLLKAIYPKLVLNMRKAMKISPEGFMESKAIIDSAIADIQTHFSGQFLNDDGSPRFFVGNAFSRADLAFAALMAPIARVKGYGIDWPDTAPPGLAELEAEYKDVVEWVSTLYSQYRNK